MKAGSGTTSIGAPRAGSEGVAGEMVANGQARQRGAGEAGSRAALRVAERPGADRKRGDVRVAGLEQRDASGPVRHFGAAVVILEQAAPGDQDPVAGRGGAEQCAHPGETRAG